jgi:hypothetical protein
MVELPGSFNSLQQQLLDAAAKFATDAQPLSDFLATMVRDVERAIAEPLEIFPVCHHSPASALHMVKRLQQQAPKVIYLELCEDLFPTIANLRDCKLPIALQAFASESATFAPEMMPLSVVAPLTEASAEYQAIVYRLEHPETELVFVDRAVDFVFQWQRDRIEKLDDAEATEPLEAETLHGAAVGIEVGDLMPTFDQFLEFLLRNSNTRHFADWWDQYVEQTLIGADYATYRQVMFLIGSLMRRLGRKDDDTEIDRQRERYMWTRMKQHMSTHQIAPQDAIYICGAAHSASDVEEFGIENDRSWDIPAFTETKWLYGLIPSSFVAIEYQFNHPPGTVTLAESTWKKSLNAAKIKPFTLTGKATNKATNPLKTQTATVQSQPATESSEPIALPELAIFLTRPPAFALADTEQLLQWCADIVGLARKNGYLASTADSIAIYQTSMLLANLRNRPHPTPYDFQDAAITCLEKDRTPKKRNIEQICKILLGGDRIGTVGYTSLPPLAQNVYDRLAPLKVNFLAQTNQRALMDFKREPELLPCSDLLWRLNYLLGDRLVQPIMGERSLGTQPIQESWEIRIGKHQRELIMLGYEGVTIEQVLEQRLRRSVFEPQAHANTALEAAEASILYLHSLRLTQEIGAHAIVLLTRETGVTDAPQIFDRVRRLVHYYRTTPTGLPDWIKCFVATGYSHYATLLPKAFGDRGTSPEQIAGMLGFIFTLESLALSLGCNHSQLLIGVQQASQATSDPAKFGLLWTTEWLLNLRSLEQMREFFDQMLTNPLLITAFPDYLNGFILALTFAPRISRFVVELLSKLFAAVPDRALLPWLPNLILRLRSHTQLLPVLIQAAAASFPKHLTDFDRWQPFWVAQAPAVPLVRTEATRSAQEQQIYQFMADHPATTEQLAQLFGIESLTWQAESAIKTDPIVADQSLSMCEQHIQALLQAQPATLTALQTLLINPV